jgi:hypothetical protein
MSLPLLPARPSPLSSATVYASHAHSHVKSESFGVMTMGQSTPEKLCIRLSAYASFTIALFASIFVDETASRWQRSCSLGDRREANVAHVSR